MGDRIPRQPRPRLRRWFLVLLLGLMLFVLAIAVPVWFKLEHPSPPPGPALALADWKLPVIPPGDRRLLLLMIDGLAVAPFQRALNEGRLPHLIELMDRRPTSSLVALATFPSATSPSVPELLSGRYVDLENLPVPGAVHAFNRDERTVMRYVTEPDAWQWPVPTLFDAIAGRPSVTVFEGRWDGPLSILTQYNLLGQAFLEAIGAAALSGGDRGPVEAYLALLAQRAQPVVSLVVLNEFDMVAHFHGPESPQALKALEKADALLGEILEALSREDGALDDTVIAIFGDHGMAPSGRYVDVAEFFAQRGIAAVDVSTATHVLFRERLGSLWTAWADAILVSGGSNITQVYLKDSRRGWHRPTGPDVKNGQTPEETARLRQLAAELATLEGIDQVLWQDAGGAIHVVSATAGTARIFSRGSGRERRFAYVTDKAFVNDLSGDLSGDLSRDRSRDPFGYLAQARAEPLVCKRQEPDDACFHDALTWIDATADTQYPGAVPLIPKAFKPAQFAGDLMLAARRGYTFLQGQSGDHGNLDRAAVMTPLVINGPGIHHCTETHQPRLVDIFPTVAVLLGASPDDPALAELDGRVLDCAIGPAPGNGQP